MAWKDVVGYEGLYLISDEGEVVSLPRDMQKAMPRLIQEGCAIRLHMKRRRMKVRFILEAMWSMHHIRNLAHGTRVALRFYGLLWKIIWESTKLLWKVN